MKTISAVVAATFVLSSCSYAYEIEATMIDGRLAFIADGAPDCISSISVSTADAKAAQAVGNGGPWVWSQHFGDCANPFPVFYGQVLKGESPPENLAAPTVVPKALIVGVVYDVSTRSEGGGYGAGRFKLMTEGSVENVSRAAR